MLTPGVFASRETRRTRGFTLLEVMVALVILALALLAAVRAASLEARALTQVRESTLAHWVAANAIAELRLNEGMPPTGRREGRVELGGRRWHWIAEIVATEHPQIRRVETQVYVDDDGLINAGDPLARLDGFVGR